MEQNCKNKPAFLHVTRALFIVKKWAAISDQLSVSSGAAMTTLIFHSFSCAFQLSTCLVVTCYLWHCFNVIHQIPAQHSSPFCYLSTLQNPEEEKKLSTCLFVCFLPLFLNFFSTFLPFPALSDRFLGHQAEGKGDPYQWWPFWPP